MMVLKLDHPTACILRGPSERAFNDWNIFTRRKHESNNQDKNIQAFEELKIMILVRIGQFFEPSTYKTYNLFKRNLTTFCSKIWTWAFVWRNPPT